MEGQCRGHFFWTGSKNRDLYARWSEVIDFVPLLVNENIGFETMTWRSLALREEPRGIECWCILIQYQLEFIDGFAQRTRVKPECDRKNKIKHCKLAWDEWSNI